MTQIEASEVADVLRKAIRGEIGITATRAGWNETYAGDCELMFGDWRLVIFNDCDELDYVSEAVAPDGRKSEFDDWETDPVELLTAYEVGALEAILDSVESP